MLQLGVDINAKDVDGWTPLHAAVHWGQNEACEVLAEHGANFSARNKMVIKLLMQFKLFWFFEMLLWVSPERLMGNYGLEKVSLNY